MPTCSNCGRQVEAEANFCPNCGQNKRVSASDPNLEGFEVIWEEYKYRHDKVWRLIIQITTAAVVLSVIPYLNLDVVSGLVWGILLVPLLAVVLVGFAFLVIQNEMYLLSRIKNKFWCVQLEVFKIPLPPEERRPFQGYVRVYLIILLVLGLLNCVIIALFWVPHVTEKSLPVTFSAEAIVAVLGLMIGVVGVGTAVITNRQQKLKAERDEAARFLMRIAYALDIMIREFRSNGIPLESGHRFINQLEKYDERLRPHLGDQTQHDLDRLHDLREKAREMNDDLEAAFSYHGPAMIGKRTGKRYEQDFKLDREKTEEWLAEMKRMVGDFNGQADDISTRPTAAPQGC